MIEHLVQKLRAQGISVTPQRLAVLSALQNRVDHPSAEQLYQEVLRQMPVISFNTVYKTLEVFCQKGLAIKVNPLHEVARYDGRTREHAHLICRGCRVIVDLEWKPSFSTPLPEPPIEGFRVENQCLVLWGLCPHCQAAETGKEK